MAKEKRISGQLIIAIILGGALIYSVSRAYRTEIEQHYYVNVIFVLLFAALGAALIYHAKKTKKQKIQPKTDTYHPTNFSGHSEFRNKGNLK
jgi:hypothetical protein